MSMYHSAELCYLAQVYTNLLITKQPMDFYFKPKADSFKDGLPILVLLVPVWEEPTLVRRLRLRNTRFHNTDERTRLRDGDESGATLSR